MINKTDSTAMTVLLAEDNPVNQEVAIGMLELLGYCVDLVENGEKALHAFLEKRYDLICMDCHMPVMDGREATRCIRRYENSRPHTARTPIVALTANAMPADHKDYIDAGMDAVIAKPFALAELASVVSAYLPVGNGPARPARDFSPGYNSDSRIVFRNR